MELTLDQQRVKSLLTETITLLCKNGLHFKSEFSIEGLLGITLDKQDVFLISIKEIIHSSEQNASTEDYEKNKSDFNDRKVEDVYTSPSSFPNRKRSRMMENTGQENSFEGHSGTALQTSSRQSSIGNIFSDSSAVTSEHTRPNIPKNDWKRPKQHSGVHNNTQRSTDVRESSMQSTSSSSCLSTLRNSKTRTSFGNEAKNIVDEAELRNSLHQPNEVAEFDQPPKLKRTLETNTEISGTKSVSRSQLPGSTGLDMLRETVAKHKDLPDIDEAEIIHIKEENLENTVEDIGEDQAYSAFLTACEKSEPSLLPQNFTFMPVSQMTSNDFGHSSAMNFSDSGEGLIGWPADMPNVNRDGQSSNASRGCKQEDRGFADQKIKNSEETGSNQLRSFRTASDWLGSPGNGSDQPCSPRPLLSADEDGNQTFSSRPSTSNQRFHSSYRFNSNRGSIFIRGIKSNCGLRSDVGLNANPRSLSNLVPKADSDPMIDRRYRCPYCPRRFSASNNLRGHLALHTGVKEFRCALCGQEFAYKHRLKTHAEKCVAQPFLH